MPEATCPSRAEKGLVRAGHGTMLVLARFAGSVFSAPSGRNAPARQSKPSLFAR